MDTLAEYERSACHLRSLKQSGEDALPRLCAAGAKMQARQFPAAAAESHLSLLLRTSRQVSVSASQSGDGKALRQPLRSTLGRSGKHPYLPLTRPILPLA